MKPTLVLLCTMLIALAGTAAHAADTKGWTYGTYSLTEGATYPMPPGASSAYLSLQLRREGFVFGASIDAADETNWIIIYRAISGTTWTSIGRPVDASLANTPNGEFALAVSITAGGKLRVYLSAYNYSDFHPSPTAGTPITRAFVYSDDTPATTGWADVFASGADVANAMWCTDPTVGSDRAGGMREQTDNADDMHPILRQDGVDADLHGELDVLPAAGIQPPYLSLITAMNGDHLAMIYCATLADLDDDVFEVLYRDRGDALGQVSLFPRPASVAFPGFTSTDGELDVRDISPGAVIVSWDDLSAADTDDEASFLWTPATGNHVVRFAPLAAADHANAVFSINPSSSAAVGSSGTQTEAGGLYIPVRWTINAAASPPVISAATSLVEELHPSREAELTGDWAEANHIDEHGVITVGYGSWNNLLIPLPTLTVTTSATTVAEPSGSVALTVTRSGSTLLPLTAGLTVSGTATAGDYSISGATAVSATHLRVVIPAGQASAVVTVQAADDAATEADETLGVALRNAINTDFADSSPFKAGDARATYNIGATSHSVALTVTSDDVDGNPATSLSLSTPSGSSTTAINASAVFTVQFAAGVTGFVAGDVTATDGATVADFVAVDADTYTFTVAKAADGAFALSVAAGVCVRSGSADGNLASTTLNLAFDSVAPAVSAPDLAGADDSGSSSSDNLTRRASNLTMSGTAESGAIVRVQEGATVLATTTASGGAWTVDIGLSGEGAHNLVAQASDRAGNATNSAALAITLDTTVPALAITAPAAGAYDDDGDITVTGTVEVGAELGLSVDGGATTSPAVIAGAWSSVHLGLGEGERVFLATATDAAGNVATVERRATVDSIAPTVALTTPLPSTAANPIAVTVTFSESVTGFDAAVDLLIVGATVASSSGSGAVYTVMLTPTAGTILVDLAAGTAADAAGNANAAVTQLAITAVTGITAVAATAIGQEDPTSASPVVFTVTFGAAIDLATFVAADCALGGTAGGTRSAVVAVDASAPSNTRFTVTVSGMATTSGTVTFAVPADRVATGASEPNAASNAASVTWNAPVVTAPPRRGGGGGGGSCGLGGGFAALGITVFLIQRRRSRA